jgi:hypothetical protein
MLALDAAQAALFSSKIVGVVWLVELDFSEATHRFTTFNVDVQVAGMTYVAAGNVATVSDIREAEDTDAQKMTISLSVANAAMLASALGNVEGYRGREARVYLLPLDENYRPVGSPRLRFAGEMEPVKISRSKPGFEGGPVGGKIDLPITRTGMSRARKADGLRLSDEQQQAEFPGDVGLEYIRSLIEKPTLWLSKRFQQ